MKPLIFKSTVVIPAARWWLPEVQQEVEAITKTVGGATEHHSTGLWFNDEGVPERERVIEVTWWTDGPLDKSGLIKALLSAGEVEVMVVLGGTGSDTCYMLRKEDYE